MNKQIILKFVKGFVSGGIASVVLALSVGVNIHSLDDVRGVLLLIVSAFVSGAIHAVAEMLVPSISISDVPTTPAI